MRTGADRSGSWVSFLVGGHLADGCGQLQKATDKSSSWVSSVGGHFADRCGQVRQVMFLDVT